LQLCCKIPAGEEKLEHTMKTFNRIAASISLMFVLIAQGIAANPPMNLVSGVPGPLISSPSWANFSALNIISGSSLLPITSPSTVLYVGFTSGTFADINNMVMYTVKRDGSRITAVTPVKLHGISNPSISLTDKTVCPNQPVSATSPCVVRLDPIALSLSPASDYYFVVYFTNDTNNNSVAVAAPELSTKTTLSGEYQQGDYTRLKVGQSVPSGNSGLPYCLMFVMTN
jgi:hypothetical protein